MFLLENYKEEAMKQLIYFPTADLARKHRHEHGTGGWILEPEDGT